MSFNPSYLVGRQVVPTPSARYATCIVISVERYCSRRPVWWRFAGEISTIEAAAALGAVSQQKVVPPVFYWKQAKPRQSAEL